MLDRAKKGAFAYPAINVSSSQTLIAALRGFAEAESDGIIQFSWGGAEYASGSTVKLVSQMVNAWRGRSIESAFADYQAALAARRNRVIALVRVAAPLSQAQQDRLATTLTSKVGQPVRINIEIDPTVLGGVSVKFADEIVDGSVSNRLAGAARALAGSK